MYQGKMFCRRTPVSRKNGFSIYAEKRTLIALDQSMITKNSFDQIVAFHPTRIQAIYSNFS